MAFSFWVADLLELFPYLDGFLVWGVQTLLRERVRAEIRESASTESRPDTICFLEGEGENRSTGFRRGGV